MLFIVTLFNLILNFLVFMKSYLSFGTVNNFSAEDDIIDFLEEHSFNCMIGNLLVSID